MSASVRRVAAAEGVIRAAWKNAHVEPWHFVGVAAQALDDAGLLMSPETAAELARLRARVGELEAALADFTEPDVDGTGRTYAEYQPAPDATSRRDVSVAKLRFLLASQRGERS